MSTSKLIITCTVVFLTVVGVVWYSYDLGYSAAQSHQIATYNDGFIDGENSNIPH